MKLNSFQIKNLKVLQDIYLKSQQTRTKERQQKLKKQQQINQPANSIKHQKQNEFLKQQYETLKEDIVIEISQSLITSIEQNLKIEQMHDIIQDKQSSISQLQSQIENQDQNRRKILIQYCNKPQISYEKDLLEKQSQSKRLKNDEINNYFEIGKNIKIEITGTRNRELTCLHEKMILICRLLALQIIEPTKRNTSPYQKTIRNSIFNWAQQYIIKQEQGRILISNSGGYQTIEEISWFERKQIKYLFTYFIKRQPIQKLRKNEYDQLI
ncbi:unnamed protein product [Paramecium sonneborni]|uniref:Uncharacterized protein n=1 Tax=Paramecium sonneborni TaxID=65129 RepID=A0A8S1R4K2_9CILI|nr:unnamed protein product [Paramecium sonneborni]